MRRTVTRAQVLRRRLRAEKVRARQAVSEALADAAFDGREADRIRSSMAAKRLSKHQQANANRVRTLIAKDRLEREADQARRDAEFELEAGSEAISLSDVAIGPTEEQFKRAGRFGYEQVAEIGTGKNARLGATVYRRRECPVAFKMVRQGVIDRAGYDACCWYLRLFESTGLAGQIPSTDFGKEVFGISKSRSLFADWQVDQQTLFRAVRREITASKLRMLDAMVLEDVSLHRAARRARAFHRDPKRGFEDAVDELTEARKKFEAEA